MSEAEDRRLLIEATKHNDIKTVKNLIEKKNVTLRASIAHIAAERGYTELLRYVVDKNPELVEERDSNGNTILHLALRNGTIDMGTLKYLVEEKNAPLTKTNDQRQTVACLAAKRGFVDIIKYVADKKPFTLFRRDIDGSTILHMKDTNKVLELIKYLYETNTFVGAQPHWDREDFEAEALHVAAQFGQMNVLKYILEEKNGDVNAENNEQQPVIFTTIKFQHHDMFKYLVEERNANLTRVDENNENILFICVNHDDLPSMKYVLDERKAILDVNWRNSYGNTILHHAILGNRTTIIEYLVEEKHANVTIPGFNLFSPLHTAANRNNLELCKYLIKHGADPLAVDEQGRFPRPTDPALEEYLKKARGSRGRRSVLPYSVDEVFSIREPSDHRISENMNGFVDGSREYYATYWNEVFSFQFPRFLMIAYSILKNVKWFTHQDGTDRPTRFSSPTAVLRSKIDSIAIDAVHNGPYRM